MVIDMIPKAMKKFVMEPITPRYLDGVVSTIDIAVQVVKMPPQKPFKILPTIIVGSVRN